MERIIGIHYGHDANVAIIENGKVVFAISEERLNREKFYEGFPFLAIKESLRYTNLKPDDFDCIALSNSKAQDATLGNTLTNYYKRLNKKPPLFVKIFSTPLLVFDNILMLKFRKLIAIRMVNNTIAKLGFSRGKIKCIEHHLCHAAGGFFLSGYKDAVVITGDGKGDKISHQTYIANNNTFTLKNESSDYNSVGLFYSCVTFFLGFKPLRHEGKITGLAAFGDLKKTSHIDFPLSFNKDSSSVENSFLKDIGKSGYYKVFIKLFRENPKLFFKILISKSYFEFEYARYKWMEFLKDNLSKFTKEDVAAFAQNHFEKILVDMVESQILDKKTNVVLSGGNFANVRLNQKISEIDGVKSVYIMPAMGDGGLAVGAALWEYWSNKKWNHKLLSLAYLGPEYSDEEIQDILNFEKLSFEKKSNISKYVAEMMASGKIVGRFNGRMEWGPRALGNRSILASAKDELINQTLNDRLNRTEFMPFAPIILEDYASEYFLGYKSTDLAPRFMTITYDVAESKKDSIAAAVHVDGTARPQVVRKNENSTLYKVLDEYNKLTGVPSVINTSFNMHEEPIVCTPNDAIRAFKEGAVDVLAIGNFIVERT
jgi:carbamoyltransferase